MKKYIGEGEKKTLRNLWMKNKQENVHKKRFKIATRDESITARGIVENNDRDDGYCDD